MADPVQYQSGTPGFSGAIMDLMKALASSFAPRSIVDRGRAINGAVEQPPASGGPPPMINNPQPPGGLGNQSPGLGNSF
jgi:hypothetical protein